MRPIFLNLILIFCSFKLRAQDTTGIGEIKEQRNALINELKRYHDIDSIAKVIKPGVLDEQAFAIAKSIDGSVDNLDSIVTLAFRNKYSEAAFLYYLWDLRFRYSVAADENLKDDKTAGALLASFEYEFGEILYPFLHANFENFDAVLKRSVDWFGKNDSKTDPQAKNPKAYQQQIENFNKMIVELEKNKEKYVEDWAEDERKQKELTEDD